MCLLLRLLLRLREVRWMLLPLLSAMLMLVG
jgi:hypothetical protein